MNNLVYKRKLQLELGLSLGYTLVPAAIKKYSTGRGIRPSTKLPDLVSIFQHFSRHLDHDLIKDTKKHYATAYEVLA